MLEGKRKLVAKQTTEMRNKNSKQGGIDGDLQFAEEKEGKCVTVG